MIFFSIRGFVMSQKKRKLAEVPTEQVTLVKYEGRGGKTGFEKISRAVSEWSSVGLCVMVLVLFVVIFFERKTGLILIKYSFCGLGALQVCAGVYLGLKKKEFFKGIVEQDEAQAAQLVRPVDQSREIYIFITKLQAAVAKGGSGIQNNADVLESLRIEYGQKVEAESSGQDEINVLSQADLVRMLSASSDSAVSGTVLLTLGTLIMALSELYPALAA